MAGLQSHFQVMTGVLSVLCALGIDLRVASCMLGTCPPRSYAQPFSGSLRLPLAQALRCWAGILVTVLLSQAQPLGAQAGGQVDCTLLPFSSIPCCSSQVPPAPLGLEPWAEKKRICFFTMGGGMRGGPGSEVQGCRALSHTTRGRLQNTAE